MRRLHTLFLLFSLCLTSVYAQSSGTGFIGDGYYRVRNNKTNRYIYVTDNKDYYDKTKDVGDFQAIQLWTDINRAIGDPATVIYIDEVTPGMFDLAGQGTSIHALTGYYVGVTKLSDGTYKVSASVSKSGIEVTKTLSDDVTSTTKEQGKMGTNGNPTYQKWVVDRITTDNTTNYFGIKPTIELNGSYYQPFFADFPFRAASPGMNIYYVSKLAGEYALMTPIEDVVPAKTPVIIECATADPSQNRLELLATSSAQVTGNQLSGVYFCNGARPQASTSAYKKFDSTKMRVFDVVDGKLVLTNSPASSRLNNIKAIDWEEYEETRIDCLFANSSYLEAKATTPDVLELTLDLTDIKSISSNDDEKMEAGVYSINGTLLRATDDIKGLPAGIYIVGGRKIAVK